MGGGWRGGGVGEPTGRKRPSEKLAKSDGIADVLQAGLGEAAESAGRKNVRGHCENSGSQVWGGGSRSIPAECARRKHGLMACGSLGGRSEGGRWYCKSLGVGEQMALRKDGGGSVGDVGEPTVRKRMLKKMADVRWHCGNLGGQVWGVGELTNQKSLSEKWQFLMALRKFGWSGLGGWGADRSKVSVVKLA